MSRRYTLELTAEEVWALNSTRLAGSTQLRDVRFKLAELDRNAVADRDAAELCLPWRVIGPHPDGGTWDLLAADGNTMHRERAAKLMSAAPELLEAVRAAREWMRQPARSDRPRTADVEELIERALRKVETGEPE